MPWHAIVDDGFGVGVCRELDNVAMRKFVMARCVRWLVLRGQSCHLGILYVCLLGMLLYMLACLHKTMALAEYCGCVNANRLSS